MSDHTTQTHRLVSMQAFHQYLQDLALIPALSPGEERAVIGRMADDPLSREAADARQRIIEGHLRLVVHLARRYQLSGLELADLVQEGNLALIQAASLFDPQRNRRFTPFARRRICERLSQVVKAHLQERHLRETERESVHPRLRTARKTSAQSVQGENEQMLVCDLPAERFTSLDVLLEENDADVSFTDERFSGHLYDNSAVTPEECLLAQERKTCLADCLQALTPRERFVLTRRYLSGMAQTLETLQAIGKTLGLSRERVRQIEQRGIQKMRHPRIASILRHLL